MSTRRAIKMSGLVQQGKVDVNVAVKPGFQFGVPAAVATDSPPAPLAGEVAHDAAETAAEGVVAMNSVDAGLPPTGSAGEADNTTAAPDSPIHSPPAPPTDPALAMEFDWGSLPSGSVIDVPLVLIDDSPAQPSDTMNSRYDPDQLELLAQAMKMGGQRDLLHVEWNPVKRRFELVSGHRRVRAGRLNGWPTMRAIIQASADEITHLKNVISHNVQRAEYTDFTRAKLTRELLDKGAVKHIAEAATLFGVERSELARSMRMLSFPEPIVHMLERKPAMIGANAGRVIASLQDEYPQHLDVLIQAVARVDQGAAQSSIKGWFHQRLQAAGHNTSEVGKIVTDSGGKPLVSLLCSGRNVHIKLMSEQVDGAKLVERLHLFMQSDTTLQGGDGDVGTDPGQG